MELRFNLVFEDLIDLQRDFVLRSKHHRKTKWVLYIVFSIIILAALSLGSFNLIDLGVFLCWIILFPYVYTKLTLYSLIRFMKKQNLETILGRNSIRLDEKGVFRKTELTKTFFDWSQFVVIRDDEKHYFLYISDTQGVIFPKSAIKENELEGEFKYYFDKFFIPKMNIR